MFAVNLAIGNSVWRLLFKDEEKAETAFNITRQRGSAITYLDLEDDFGQKCYFPISELHGAMFEDLEKAKMANVELFLHQERVKHMAQKAAQSDPGLRANAAMAGPAIMTPFAGRQNN
jgi:hypothetical protein